MNCFIKQSTYFFLTTSFLLAVVGLKAQTVDELVKFANQQFEKQNYEIAAQEYNRALFFGYPKKDAVALMIGHCYQNESDFNNAGEFYDKAYLLSNNDSIQNEAVLNKAFCLVMQEKFVLAMSELYNINETFFQHQQPAYHFLSGIILFGLKQDTLALQQFELAIKTNGDFTREQLQLLNNEFQEVYSLQKRFNPRRAYFMSAFVPGSGQIASGEIKEGVNSMLLIGLLYYASIRIAASFTPIDAMLTLIPWVQRYYMGGMDKAELLAESKIDQERYKAYLNIIELASPNSFK